MCIDYAFYYPALTTPPRCPISTVGKFVGGAVPAPGQADLDFLSSADSTFLRAAAFGEPRAEPRCDDDERFYDEHLKGGCNAYTPALCERYGRQEFGGASAATSCCVCKSVIVSTGRECADATWPKVVRDGAVEPQTCAGAFGRGLGDPSADGAITCASAIADLTDWRAHGYLHFGPDRAVTVAGVCPATCGACEVNCAGLREPSYACPEERMTPTAAADEGDGGGGGDGDVGIGVIAGAVGGGAAALLLAVGAYWCWLRSRGGTPRTVGPPKAPTPTNQPDATFSAC